MHPEACILPIYRLQEGMQCSARLQGNCACATSSETGECCGSAPRSCQLTFALPGCVLPVRTLISVSYPDPYLPPDRIAAGRNIGMRRIELVQRVA